MNPRQKTSPQGDREEADPYKEEDFQLLVDAVTEYAIFRLDPEGHIVSWNTGAEQIKGYAPEEILGRHFSLFYTEEDTEAGMPGYVLNQAEKEGVWTGKGWRVRKDGRRFWAHVTLTALFDEDGKLRGFGKVTRDMTERHEREEELKQARRRAERETALLKLMEAVATTANEATSLEQSMQLATEAVCEYTGWPVGHAYRIHHGEEDSFVSTGIWYLEDEHRFGSFREVTDETTFSEGRHLPGRAADSGSPVWIRDVTEDPDFERAAIAESLGLKGAFGIPVQHDREIFAVLEFLAEVPIEPDEKLYRAMESVGVQLSRVAERAHARAMIRESEERYRRLFEEAQEGLAITTPEGEIVDVNPALVQILGYSREELLTMNAAELYPDPDERRAAANKIAREGAVRNMELHARRKDGKVLTLEFSATAQRGPDGEVVSFQSFLHDVTERRKAQEALRESERRYRRLFEESQEGISITAPDGTIIDVNPAVCELNGYSREELIGMNASELYRNSDEREALARHLQEEGRVRDFELELVRKDGQELICQVSASAWMDEEGEIEAIQSFARDVTERKKALEALRESEVKFRTLSEKALVGIGLIQDGVYQYVNPRIAEITGYSREELIGHPPAELFHPDDRMFVEEHLRQRFAGEVEEAHYEARLLTKQGEERIVELIGSRLMYEGKPAIIGMMHDVTERNRTEEALRESEQKFRALSEEAPVGILVIQNGRLAFANEALAQMYGYEREELLGRRYTETLVHPDDRDRVRDNIDLRLRGNQESLNFRFRGLTREGQSIQVDAHGARVEYGGRPAIIGMDIDVTDRVRLQREVLNMQEEERRRLGRDLHDGVASQLTSIALMVSLLSRRLKTGKLDPEALPDELDEVEERVAESCEDVRRLSRGLAPSGLSGEELPAALERLAHNTEQAGFEHNLQDLQKLSDATAAQLYWIAQEALANARKYAGADRITIRLLREEGSLALEVEDDGQGFDPAKVENGSLGLRTMRYRSELLGGTYTLDTAPGKGTCVRCRLPI